MKREIRSSELALDRLAEAGKRMSASPSTSDGADVRRGDYRVGKRAEACAIPSDRVSEHLGRMKDCGLLPRKRDGRRMYNRVGEEGLAAILARLERRFGNQG